MTALAFGKGIAHILIVSPRGLVSGVQQQPFGILDHFAVATRPNAVCLTGSGSPKEAEPSATFCVRLMHFASPNGRANTIERLGERAAPGGHGRREAH